MSNYIFCFFNAFSLHFYRCVSGYAREHQPCIIFMDEIDAIGGRRFSDGNSSDREIQRTLMEVLSSFCTVHTMVLFP